MIELHRLSEIFIVRSGLKSRIQQEAFQVNMNWNAFPPGQEKMNSCGAPEDAGQKNPCGMAKCDSRT
jgi:hypothetical protein